MALILSIETATKSCSVALHTQGQLVTQATLLVEKSHATALPVLIQNLLTTSPYTPQDLAAVAISQGPGSYTGLRIGTATAKGICYALQIPLLAVNTLTAMAYGINQYNITNALLCPMLDARRLAVYCLLADSQGQLLLPTQAQVMHPQCFQSWLQNHTILFFGDGAAKCKPLFAHQQHARFLADVYPTAQHIGPLAYQRFQQHAWEDLSSFEPLYLKEGKQPHAPT